MKLEIAALLIVTLVLSSSSIVEVESTATAPSPTPALAPTLSSTPTASQFGCDGKCQVRCSRSGWRKQCLRLCGICCSKCKGCVPSGPYADKAQCPCYRDMKNPKGKDKCP